MIQPDMTQICQSVIQSFAIRFGIHTSPQISICLQPKTLQPIECPQDNTCLSCFLVPPLVNRTISQPVDQSINQSISKSISQPLSSGYIRLQIDSPQHYSLSARNY